MSPSVVTVEANIRRWGREDFFPEEKEPEVEVVVEGEGEGEGLAEGVAVGEDHGCALEAVIAGVGVEEEEEGVVAEEDPTTAGS